MSINAKAYLSGIAPVQNPLLELRTQRRRYAARTVATGRSGEGIVTKGPGRETPGDGISACVVRQLPPLDEASRMPEILPSPVAADGRGRTTGVMRVAAWRKRS